MLQPNLGAVVTFLSAPAARRHAVAVQIATQGESDYAVETDFWKRMRSAIVRDRRSSRDGLALHEAASAAIAKKRPSFSAVADRWPEVAARWTGGAYLKPIGGLVSVGGVDVAVRPLFSEILPDGTVEDVAVWMNVAEPSHHAVRAAMRLMTRLDPERSRSAAFVDARRGSVWAASAVDLEDADFALERLGADLLRETA